MVVQKVNKVKVHSTRTKGSLGETVAREFLERKGFAIVETNLSMSFGEVDIIATKGGTWHFIEVKSVSRESTPTNMDEQAGYRPEELVHARKVYKIRRVAEAYLVSREINAPVQIDAVAVELYLRQKKAVCRFIEHAENL